MISRHLQILQEAGIVCSCKQGGIAFMKWMGRRYCRICRRLPTGWAASHRFVARLQRHTGRISKKADEGSAAHFELYVYVCINAFIGAGRD